MADRSMGAALAESEAQASFLPSAHPASSRGNARTRRRRPRPGSAVERGSSPSRARPERSLLDLLEASQALVAAFVASEADLPRPELRDPAYLRENLAVGLGTEGVPVEEALARLSEVLRATPSSSSPRFLNQLFGGREPLATVADLLTAVANVSMYTFKAAGAQILVENELLRRMGALAGFSHCEGTFTPGGSIANLVALLLARNEAFPEGRNHGLDGRRFAIYTSVEGHYSIPKNAGIIGVGRRQVRRIAVDETGRMIPAALAEEIARDQCAGVTPLLVNATAGTTVRGAFDPIRPLANLARRAGAWLHVDGALGASLLLCPSTRHLLDGLELADSVSWNPHKMMGVPLQASALLVARPGALARSLDETADYLFQADEADLNPGHRSIQCGRRNDALKLWAAWLHLGDDGWARRMEHQLALARRAAKLIAADPELELAEWPPSINVNFVVRGAASEAVCALLDRESRLKIGFGQVGERSTIRLVCVNPALQEHDLAWVLAEIKRAGAVIRNGQ